MNILFVMYDQLRFDYLSCAGHPHLTTPNFDRVAKQGVRFSQAYVQSPICGPSRMSFYTGRYVSSHGASWNGFPLRVGEHTMGDHLRRAGMDCWLIGKTHMKADAAGMARLGLTADSVIGARQSECGFDTWIRDDGLWGYGPDGYYDENRSPYNAYLQSKGYESENPWADFANAGIDEDGNMASGWMFMNADKPANIDESDSETPWLTRQAMDFIDQTDGPWCAHVSYIKPHWPYIVPAPYHNMFGPEHVPPAARDDVERDDPNPLLAAYMSNKMGEAFQREEVREKVIPAYMGLIKQCDDQLGVLLDHLEETGKLDSTMIVLTSDHGDYLGDHWMGEKEFFHDPAVKIPMIVYDPRAEADGTRGTTCDALVEAIDLVPTFVEAAGGDTDNNILEGRSLLPWLRGEVPEWRDVVVCEYDYSVTPQAARMDLEPDDCRIFMVYDGRYKLIHAEGGIRPILFDLHSDPEEFFDLAKGADHAKELDQMYAHLAKWGRRNGQRITKTNAEIKAMRGKSMRRGILPFLVDGSEVPDALTALYRGPAPKRFAGD